MAFATKGSLGTSLNTGNNQSTFTHTTTTTTLSAGNFGVLIYAVDNNATTNGDEVCVSNVTDSAGNTWSKAAEFTNAQTAAQAGALVSVWYCDAVNSLAIGGTITGTLSNNASRDESCSTAWAFTVTGGVAIKETPTTQESDAVDVGNLDVATASEERLRVRAIGIESNDGTQMTNTVNWTLFTNTRSANIATAISVRGEWVISNGPGDGSNPTLAITTGDAASVYVAFAEVSQHSGAATFSGAGNLSANSERITPNVQLRPPLRSKPYAPARLRQYGFVQGLLPRLAVSGPTAHSGEATFNGTGNLSAATVQRMVAAATFAGTGNLSVNVTARMPVAATFAGAGSLSVATRLVMPTFATFGGVGSMSASVPGRTTGAATFQGAGSMSVATSGRTTGAATFAGAGNLSVLANLRMVIAATFGGAGNLTVDSIQAGFHSGAATFSGSGNLSAQTTQVHAASAIFAGIGTLSVSGFEVTVAQVRAPYFVRPVRKVRINYGFVQGLLPRLAAPAANTIEATFAGSGSLSARATLRMVISARFAGTGSISAVTVAEEFMPSMVMGWPVLRPKFPTPNRSWRVQPITLMAGVIQHSGEVRFNGAGGLSVNANLTMQIAARFNGAGNLTASVQQAGFHEGQATFNGAGSMSVSVRQIHVQGATLQGAGNLSVNVTAKLGAAAIFNGAGDLRADTVLAGFHSGSATFNGTGNMSVAVTQCHVERATFAGTGSLSVVASLKMPASAIFGGLGVLSVDAFKPVAFAQATLNGAGLLSVSTIARQAALASFNGAGNFTITVVARYAASVQFTGTGNMLVSVVQRETAAVRFDGTGNLSANANLRMQVAARFAGASSLTVDTLHVPFGFNFCEAQFNGRGGMICDTLQFGPRHVHSSRPQIGVTSTRPDVPSARRPQPPAQKRTGT